MALWVPPTVSAALLAERQQREARMLEVVQKASVCREFDPELARIDPHLSMVFCPDPAPLDAVSCGARPGRYNVMRQDPRGGPMSFMPVVGPAGEFVEPTSAIFNELAAMDWWDPRVRRERRELEDRIEAARAKRREEERREIDEEVMERWIAASRVQVSMNRDVAWSQNAAGGRSAKAAAKGRT